MNGIIDLGERLNRDELLTAEMLVNKEQSKAAYLIRPLSDFPRSLIAKRIDHDFMFSIEPCKTRPNKMSQKIIDGEAFYLQPGGAVSSRCIIGFTDADKLISKLKQAINASAGE